MNSNPSPRVLPLPPLEYADLFSAAQFAVEMVPAPLWNLTLQKSLSHNAWAELRSDTLDRAGHRCEACGESGSLECHEEWTYDDTHLRQRLARLRALCKPCHEAKTPGRLAWLEETGQTSVGACEAALERIARLNGWTPDSCHLRAIRG